MRKPKWWYRLHNPGALLWWPGYLAWKHLRICWLGHRPTRVGRYSECDRFWWAEEDLLDYRRHPENWQEWPSWEEWSENDDQQADQDENE